jgi:hypothetical protein
VHGEAGALAGLAGDADVAAVALDDGVADRQAEAGAGALLGGEEGVEDARQVFGGDALAGVADGDLGAHAAAFLQPVAARQGEPAAVGHGLEGIHDEVDEHLLQLAQVHLDAAAGAVVDAHLDLAALEVVARQHQAVGEGLGGSTPSV